jgi:hypothetical protein
MSLFVAKAIGRYGLELAASVRFPTQKMEGLGNGPCTSAAGLAL